MTRTRPSSTSQFRGCQSPWVGTSTAGGRSWPAMTSRSGASVRGSMRCSPSSQRIERASIAASYRSSLLDAWPCSAARSAPACRWTSGSVAAGVVSARSPGRYSRTITLRRRSAWSRRPTRCSASQGVVNCSWPLIAREVVVVGAGRLDDDVTLLRPQVQHAGVDQPPAEVVHDVRSGQPAGEALLLQGGERHPGRVVGGAPVERTGDRPPDHPSGGLGASDARRCANFDRIPPARAPDGTTSRTGRRPWLSCVAS